MQLVMADAGLGQFFENYTCMCNDQADKGKPFCPVCSASGLPCGAGAVKWLLSPDAAKSGMICCAAPATLPRPHVHARLPGGILLLGFLRR